MTASLPLQEAGAGGDAPPRGFVVVFDAGSSGTRVHIYNFLPHAVGDAVPVIDPAVNSVQTLKQKPGLSYIAETYSPKDMPVHVANALNPLLDFARSFVPRWTSCQPSS